MPPYARTARFISSPRVLHRVRPELAVFLRGHSRALAQSRASNAGTFQGMAERRHVRPLPKEALESLTTERVLAYRKSLLALEDSPTATDLDGSENAALDPAFIYFKDDPAWVDLYGT